MTTPTSSEGAPVPDGGRAPDHDHVPAGVRTMAILRWGLVAGMAAAAALSIAYATGALARVRGGTAREASEHLYQCPMHPAVVQDHPGECPICGMTLVPKLVAAPVDPAARAAGGAGPVVPGLGDFDLSADRVQLAGLRTAKVQRATVGDALRAVGVVAADERGLAQISVRFSGWVQKLLVAETGQRVSRDQVLAVVYSPDVLRAQQEFLTARGWVTGAAPPGDAPPGAGGGDLAADARRRLELLGVAGPEIDALVARGKVSDGVPVRSPVAGVVTARNVVPGAAVQPGVPLFEVADLSRVWVQVDVPERDAARLRVGQKATLRLAAYPTERFVGRAQFIAPMLNTSSRTLRVRLEFTNRGGAGGGKLRPGMSGDVTLEVPAVDGLVIPAEALVDTGLRQYVFVTDGRGHFSPRPVHVAGRQGDQVLLGDGLREGETVVTTGNFLLDSESRLRAAIEGQK